ncbi:MAG TPA: HIT domain-containing protein [Calditrichaeota bacterium]|nr:HIT domain-containing protein [Calditrichota bacterium]
MKQLWAPWRMEYILNELGKTDGCIFCQFPQKNNDEKYLIVYRSPLSFVILNKFPYNNGHLMVVPYQHTGDILDLSEDVLIDLQRTIRKSVQVLRNVMQPHAMNIGMNLGRSAGAGIDTHLHYHIVPRWDGDTNFMPVLAGTKIVSESLTTTWKKLQNEFKRLYGGEDKK